MSRRPTANETVCADFRRLLTTGFYLVDDLGEIRTDELALNASKPWRGELWKAFRQLEDRLCPVKAFEEGRA